MPSNIFFYVAFSFIYNILRPLDQLAKVLYRSLFSLSLLGT